MRVLLTGWPSFLHGEATAGDVLSMEAVAETLTRAGVPHESAWSPGFHPESLHLDDAPPERYTHVLFVCGPAHGEQVRALHRRYAQCRRVAVGVSVIDPADPAVTGFDEVLARDGGDHGPYRDLAAVPASTPVPVVGMILAPGQGEYGARRRHDEVAVRTTAWLRRRDCALVPLDTRLDTHDWRCFATADQFTAVLRRLDMVVTMRLHGLVLGLRHGVPALTIDPVDGGAKVTAQAHAWGWPALLTPGDLPEPEAGGCTGDGAAPLPGWYDWCLSPQGRSAAAAYRGAGTRDRDSLLGGVLTALGVARSGATSADS